jgi:hypothetical protein
VRRENHGEANGQKQFANPAASKRARPQRHLYSPPKIAIFRSGTRLLLRSANYPPRRSLA